MKTLYSRIVLTTIVVMIISSVLAFIFSNIYYQQFLKPYNDKKVTRMAKDIQVFYKSNSNVNIDAYLNNVGSLGYQIYLVDKDGKGSFYGEAFKDKNIESKVIKSVLNGDVYHGISRFPTNFFTTGFFENGLTNTIGVKVTVDSKPYALFIRPDVEVQFGELRIFFAILLVLTILISILFVAISTRYIVKPLKRLTEATKSIEKGKYTIDLNVKRRDEIGNLANHFSQMAGSLEQLEEMRQEFVSNVSHEIQSPLSSIQGFSQTLQTEKLSKKERKRYLSIIEDESRRLSLLSKQLLTLASLDKEDKIMKKDSFDLAAQMKQVLFMTEWNWQQKDIAIDMELPSTVIHADQKLLHLVWTNLITNSIKFTNQGGTISIKLSKNDDGCHIEIEDNGIGISKSDLPFIFNRFYKADKARNRKEGSSGLGLAITKKIIELHGGQIHAKSKVGKGTTFYVHLPLM
ncbi:sensor histidine kinase [Bacillus seohaeanensis]|uniref:Heme sensor protein HssS n=1 Tax=Bacillus seohaeanensis TaxID=284580 RepID=A0ABW5RNH4_9BACI